MNSGGFGNHAPTDFDDGFLRRKQRRNRTTFTLQQVIIYQNKLKKNTHIYIGYMQIREKEMGLAETSLKAKQV